MLLLTDSLDGYNSCPDAQFTEVEVLGGSVSDVQRRVLSLIDARRVFAIRDYFTSEAFTNGVIAAGLVMQAKLQVKKNLEPIWQERIDENIGLISKKTKLNDYQDCFKNSDVVIVGAGPSVEDEIEWIKQCEGEKIIMACSAALPYLDAHGVTPDFVVVYDAASPPVDCYLEDVSVICGQFAPRWWMERADYVCVCESAIEPDMHPKPIYGGPSVTTLMVAISLYLGFRELTLVGVDLSLKHGKSHAGGEPVNVDEHNMIHWPTYELNGFIIEGKVTTLTWLSFKFWLEAIPDLLQRLGMKKVLKNRSNGLKIKGWDNGQ